MRYFMLLVCLASFTSAYAYNEIVSAVVYNPSRLGAYDYLKIVKYTSFKSGLGAKDNKTELNIYGPVTIADSAANFTHKINTVKSLTNYTIPGTSKTFGDGEESWVQNPRATVGSGNLQSSGAWLTGNEDNSAKRNAIIELYENANQDQTDIKPIPRVYMFGGKLSTAKSGPKIGYAVIQNIKGFNLSTADLMLESNLPSDFVKIDADVVIPSETGNEGQTTPISFTDYLQFGNTRIQNNPIMCGVGQTPSFEWKERKDNEGNTIRILARNIICK